MNKILASPRGATTGVGSLPFIDPDIACDVVRKYCQRLPYIPTLPKRGILERIVFSDSEHLPGKIIEEERLLIDRSRDITNDIAKIYEDFLGKNFIPYLPTPDYYSCFDNMLSRNFQDIIALKFQLTGPVTFGMQVVDRERKPILYDPELADMLPKLIALRARAAEDAIRERTGVDETLIVMDEPYYASLGSSVVPLDKEQVREGFTEIVTTLKGAIGVHCCANTDWEFVLSLKPAVLSFDAYTNANEFLLYRDKILDFMRNGGVIAWGVVPSEGEVFRKETIDRLIQRFQSIRERAIETIPSDLFDRQSLITPTCGIRLADEETAIDIMESTNAVSESIHSFTS